MDFIQLEIEITTFICEDCGNLNVMLQSKSSSNCPPSLWIGKNCNHLTLIYQDAYYDETLRKRYENNNMICPICKENRAVEVRIMNCLGEKLSCKKCLSSKVYLLSKEIKKIEDVLVL